MDEFNVGNCDIEISNCPKIGVYNLKIRSEQKRMEVDFGGGIEHRSIGPLKFEVKFKTSEDIRNNSKQVWFHQFNNTSQISAHLGREKLKLYLDVNYNLSLIGYLMLSSVDSETGYTWFNFKFNGVNGEDINLVPSPYLDEDPEAPTTEELAEDFEAMTKKVIASAKPKPEFKKKVSFKKSDEIIVIQRKITF